MVCRYVCCVMMPEGNWDQLWNGIHSKISVAIFLHDSVDLVFSVLKTYFDYSNGSWRRTKDALRRATAEGNYQCCWVRLSSFGTKEKWTRWVFPRSRCRSTVNRSRIATISVGLMLIVALGVLVTITVINVDLLVEKEKPLEQRSREFHLLPSSWSLTLSSRDFSSTTVVGVWRSRGIKTVEWQTNI